jgi:SMC interacting uncharacterized protein involved in chromosome segregation
MGLSAEQVDEIVDAHMETVNALKEERDGYKAKAKQYDDAAEQLEKANKELESLKEKNGDSYKEKYEASVKEFEDFKKNLEAENAKKSKVAAYKELLKEIGISEKRIGAVAKLADLNSFELGEDGKIKGADKLKESLTEEWSDFIESEHVRGAKVETPPKGKGGKMSKEDILKIKDAGERQAAMAENHELFGF